MPNLGGRWRVAERKRTMQLPLLKLFVASIVPFAIATLVHSEAGDAQTLDPATPVGRWKTVDDVTGKINSLVDIREQDGKLYGRIEKLINPDPNDPAPRCISPRLLWTRARDAW